MILRMDREGDADETSNWVLFLQFWTPDGPYPLLTVRYLTVQAYDLSTYDLSQLYDLCTALGLYARASTAFCGVLV